MSTQCSKHVQECNKLVIYKTRIFGLSWSVTKIMLRCTASKTSKNDFGVCELKMKGAIVERRRQNVQICLHHTFKLYNSLSY